MKLTNFYIEFRIKLLNTANLSFVSYLFSFAFRISKKITSNSVPIYSELRILRFMLSTDIYVCYFISVYYIYSWIRYLFNFKCLECRWCKVVGNSVLWGTRQGWMLCMLICLLQWAWKQVGWLRKMWSSIAYLQPVYRLHLTTRLA